MSFNFLKCVVVANVENDEVQLKIAEKSMFSIKLTSLHSFNSSKSLTTFLTQHDDIVKLFATRMIAVFKTLHR